MADLSENLYTETPVGSITCWGMDELLALHNAVGAAEDMYDALVRDSDTTKHAPRITISSVSKKVFRVEISAQVELTENMKKLFEEDNNEVTKDDSDNEYVF